MSGFHVATLEQIDELDDGRVPMRPVRMHLGITAFGANAFTAPNSGDRLINEHTEDDERHEELYVVLSGRARFEIDGQSVDAPAGTYVYVEPAPSRTAFAEEPNTTILAVGGTQGEAYRDSGWETWMALRQLYDAGRFDEVADRAEQMMAGMSQPAPAFLYNVACAESLAGRKADAIGHLRQAIEQEPKVRNYIDGDTDLDPLRDEPEFKALLSA